MQVFLPGDLVAERFRIERFIAEGGMGAVYEAEDQILGENVALKFLNRRHLDNDRITERFRREILLARKVTHPNVCRIFDVFRHQDGSGKTLDFVTMELLGGETMEEFLERRGPLDESLALAIVRQLAEGLMAAHAADVIHRDFKSNNVMLVPTPQAPEGLRAVITDFGLARTVSRGEDHDGGATPLTGENHLVGTIDYMSPEQLNGDPLGPATDLYSLGVVMFEMVTGSKPFTAPNMVSLIAKRIHEDPPSPRELRTDLGPRWEKAILHCLEKDPARRPASCWDLLVELAGEEIFSGPQSSGTVLRPPLETLLADVPEPAPPQPPPPRRWPWAIALSVAVTTTLLWFLGLLGGEPDSTWSQIPVQVTTAPGLELDPVFSPGGEVLVFSSDRSGSFELWKRDLGAGTGSGEVQLTFDGDQIFEPDFAPGGKTLVYHSKSRGGIWALDLDDDFLPIAEPSQLAGFGSRPAVSPDGRWIAFQSESSPQLADTSAPALSQSTLWVLRLEDKTRRRVTRASAPNGGHAAPSWSPDGTRLVFSTSLYGRSEIWTVTVEDGEIQPLVTDLANGYDPVYSPDGRSVYFSASSRQVSGLWRVPVSPRNGRATGEPRQIRNLGLASIRQLAFSHSGDRMAYTAIKTSSDLFSLPIDPDTSTPADRPTPLTRHGGRNNRPVFSPEGDRVAFDRWQLGLPIDLWVLDLDRDEETQITTRDGNDSQSSWFPDGRRLAFHSNHGDQRGLWSVDLAARDRPPTELARLPDDVFWATLSPQGTHVAYHSTESGRIGIFTQELATGEVVTVVDPEDLPGFDDNRHFLGFPVWSPDGLWLAYQYRQAEENTQAMLVPSSGGASRQLTHGAGESWPYSFSPRGDKIAFAARREDSWTLAWISRITGEEVELIGDLGLNRYVRYPAWSPREDRIVYELARSTGDIYLVEDG